MRFHVVIRYVAFALLINSAFMFLSAGISIYYGDVSTMPLLYSAFITLLFGLFPLIFVPAATNISNKEALLIVVMSWFISCLTGALPYVLYGGQFTFTNAWFESVSGFTTTGSTILTDIEIIPNGLLFWRAATHWIGGIGIIIFVLAVLPFLGIAEVILFRSELSSMARDNFRERASRAIQILAGVYLGLTLLEILSLLLAGMNLFDAVVHSFATIATGGFSDKNASIAYYNSPLIENIIIVFMLLSGIHFAILFSVVSGNAKAFWKSTIVRYYIGANIAATIVASVNIHLTNNVDWMNSVRYAAFNIISVGTSTGFANADTSIWPSFSQIILIFFALQCACAGSTSGGIKTDRIVLLWKSFIHQIRQNMHPNAVIPIKVDGKVIPDSVVNKSVLYVGVYLGVVFAATLLLTALGVDLLEAFSGTVATMGNVGPGLGAVGSVGNFNGIPELGKWILSIVMLMGRLEIYAFFIVFTPKQWSRTVTY
ncbi:MAG: TrkH family potassium uptake protein [Chlorobi bacterium]|nr:TrkH family potassium uptake protein [Chlorobiota bacterium]